MLRHDFKSANVNEKCGNYSVFFEICERLPRRVDLPRRHEGRKKHEGGFVSSLMFKV